MEPFERRWETGRRGQGQQRGAAQAPAQPGIAPAMSEPGPAGRSQAMPGYYGVPVIHKSHWKWLVIVYFFLGGISGGSYLIASLADLFGPLENRRIARAGRYVSFATLLPCPVLLVLDLGRPARFLKMLRVLKLRSPMSVGTWGLTVFGGFSTLSAVIQATQDGLLGTGRWQRRLARLPARRIGAAGTPFGFFVGGYTGVLLGATAVPVWAKSALLLGPLFLSSALSTATSAITLMLSSTDMLDDATQARLDRLERVAIGAELSCLAASIARLGPTARPLVEGQTGKLFRYGTIGAGCVAPLLLQAIPTARGRRSRAWSMLAATLALSGGFMLRYVMITAGHASADDPGATFEYARARPGR